MILFLLVVLVFFDTISMFSCSIGISMFSNEVDEIIVQDNMVHYLND